jgi:hypothetical protein
MGQAPAHDGAVILLETRTGFEAEAIAAALNARGIAAQTADTATAMTMSNVLVRSKVLVPAHLETLAKQVLDEVKAEMTEIDWDTMDVGPAEDVPRMHAARRGRRMMSTVTILLVPVGLAVLALGTQRRDVMLQAIGGSVVLCSAAIALSLMYVAGRKVDPDD